MKFKRTGSKVQGDLTWTFQDYKITAHDGLFYTVYIRNSYLNRFENLADAKSYILSRNTVDTTSLAGFFEV